VTLSVDVTTSSPPAPIADAMVEGDVLEEVVCVAETAGA